ncbi:MAG: hypothetical protein AAF196_12230 [Planctomycetota bacterium]
MTAVRTLSRVAVFAAVALALSACGTPRRTIMIPRFSDGFDDGVAAEKAYGVETETERRHYELSATAVGRTLILIAVVDALPGGEIDPGAFGGRVSVQAGACRIELPIRSEDSGVLDVLARASVQPSGCTTLESASVRVTGEGAARRVEVEIRLPIDVMRQNDGSLQLDFNEDGVEGVVTLPAEGEIRCVYLQQ